MNEVQISAPEYPVEPASGTVVLDKEGVAWQRGNGDDRNLWWRCRPAPLVGHSNCAGWKHLLDNYGPVRVVEASRPFHLDPKARAVALVINRIEGGDCGHQALAESWPALAGALAGLLVAHGRPILQSWSDAYREWCQSD